MHLKKKQSLKSCRIWHLQSPVHLGGCHRCWPRQSCRQTPCATAVTHGVASSFLAPTGDMLHQEGVTHETFTPSPAGSTSPLGEHPDQVWATRTPTHQHGQMFPIEQTGRLRDYWEEGGASWQFQLNVLEYSLTEINSKNCVVYISINMGAITNNVSESQHSWWSGINNPVMIRWSLNSRQTEPSWSLLSITVCERRSSWDWCTGKKTNKQEEQSVAAASLDSHVMLCYIFTST